MTLRTPIDNFEAFAVAMLQGTWEVHLNLNEAFPRGIVVSFLEAGDGYRISLSDRLNRRCPERDAVESY